LMREVLFFCSVANWRWSQANALGLIGLGKTGMKRKKRKRKGR